MSKPIVARAILITDANREKISVVNNGVVPNLEEFQTYFVLPYNPNFYNAIFPKKQFLENYEFVEPESFTHFVDIVEK